MLQHLEMEENHMGVGTGGLRVRAPTMGFSKKILVYLSAYPRLFIGTHETCILQYDFSASLVPERDL